MKRIKHAILRQFYYYHPKRVDFLTAIFVFIIGIVDVRPEKPIKITSHRTVYHAHTFLSLREGLKGPEMMEAAAVHFGSLVLGHAFRRSTWSDLHSDRREYRQALMWADEMLISDEAMVMAA